LASSNKKATPTWLGLFWAKTSLRGFIKSLYHKERTMSINPYKPRCTKESKITCWHARFIHC